MDSDTNAERDENRHLLITSQDASCYLEPKHNVGFAWSERILKVLKLYIHTQYELACLSTLGGAYHLCNRPQQALALAIRQERVGKTRGIPSITIRAKIFQAINHGLLGRKSKALRLFDDARRDANSISDVNLMHFCEASLLWYMKRK